MLLHLITPALKCPYGPNLSAKPFFVTKEFFKAVPGRQKHGVGKIPAVVTPDNMKVMTYCECDVKVWAIKGLEFPALEPYLGFGKSALGTTPMFA
jgi:hypothetical protein